jgi:two-component system chemotaxis response regulator CheV
MSVERTQEDRLELLLFHLDTKQPFGINILKVKEIITCPKLTHVPQTHPAVRGVTQLRDHVLTVLDLSQAIGRKPLSTENDSTASVIVAEFNRGRQGFLVSEVDRIVVCDWQQVFPPPSGTGQESYITGVTRVNEQLVEILDVERIIGEVVEVEGAEETMPVDEEILERIHGRRVLVVDDSLVARHKTTQTLDRLGLKYVTARDGKEAVELLLRTTSGELEPVDMVISDIEMPEMDGYTFTRTVRDNPKLSSLYILLHTSLDGDINTQKAQQSGADGILTKFVPDDLAHAVITGLTR